MWQEAAVTPACVTTDASAVTTVTKIAPPVVEIVPPAVEEKQAPSENTADDAEDGKISFSASQQQTLDEQYRALSREQKRFYDKIAAYAARKATNATKTSATRNTRSALSASCVCVSNAEFCTANF